MSAVLNISVYVDITRMHSEALFFQYGILRLGIFGSVARKENTEDSDIDIVVEIEKPSLSGMYELRESLKSLLSSEVDLVRYRNSLRPLFKSNIQRDVIYV